MREGEGVETFIQVDSRHGPSESQCDPTTKTRAREERDRLIE